MVGIAGDHSAMAPHAQVDMRSVSACVTAVATAYADAEKLVERIKTANQSASSNPDLESFEQSLRLGGPVVRGQYNQDVKRYGDSFASGDPSARESLKDIVINLQLSLLATLRMSLLDDVTLDCEALQKASDNSRVEAITCLYQLGERMANRSSSRASEGSSNNNNSYSHSNNNADTRHNSNDENISPTARPISTPTAARTSPEVPRSAAESSTSHPRTGTPQEQQRHDGESAGRALSPSSIQQSRAESRMTMNSSSTDFAQQQRHNSQTAVSTMSSNSGQQPLRHDSRTTVSAMSRADSGTGRSHSPTSTGSMVQNNHDQHQQQYQQQYQQQQQQYQQPRGIDVVISSEQPYGSKSNSTTDLVPHPLWSTPPHRHASDGYNPASVPSSSGGPSRDDTYHPSTTGRPSSSGGDGAHPTQPRNFIAELEDPNPIPRPRSQPSENPSTSQQSGGNSVFISADLSLLIGPGPDDPFGGFDEPEPEPEAQPEPERERKSSSATVEPNTSKPLPPHPQPDTKPPPTSQRPPGQPTTPRYGVFPPVQTFTTSITAGNNDESNNNNNNSTSKNANNGSSKNANKALGPSSMLTGLRDRAKRVGNKNPPTYVPYHPPEGNGNEKSRTISPQPGQGSSADSKGRNVTPSPVPDGSGGGSSVGIKGRNIQVPRALNLSGFKRGFGKHSSNASTSESQNQTPNRTLTTKQMTFVTDLNPPIYMPSEENNFAGFCKGAWKLQNGIKGAFSLEARPVGVYARENTFRCAKCMFEVPPDVAHRSPYSNNNSNDTDSANNNASSNNHSSGPWSNHPARQILAAHHQRQQNNSISGGAGSGPQPNAADSTSIHSKASNNSTGSTSGANGFEQTVHTDEATGIRYRWMLLAKCHVQSRTVHTNTTGMTGDGFGCIFCCSLMKGSAPVFGNVQSFLEHLTGHAAEEGRTEGSGTGVVAHGPGGAGGGAGGPYGMPGGGMVSYVPGTELLRRTKCIVGRVAGDHEDFDVNIPPRVAGVI